MTGYPNDNLRQRIVDILTDLRLGPIVATGDNWRQLSTNDIEFLAARIESSIENAVYSEGHSSGYQNALDGLRGR